MASKKQLVQSDMLVLQGLENPDLGYVAIGAKSNGFYIRIRGELEKKLADVNDLREVIQSATLNSSGQLILTLYDNSEVNVGLVKGEDGKGITNTVYDSNTGKITFTYSDSTTYVTSDLRAGTVKSVNNVLPDTNGNVIISTGENVTTDAVNTALNSFTTGTPQDSDYLTFVGKIKITLANFRTLLSNTFVSKNATITGATKTKITYDNKGLVTAGSDLTESDIPTLSQSKITNLITDLAEKSPTSHDHSEIYEPIIAKSVGLLSWTGSAWTWVTNNFITSVKTIAGKSLIGTGDVALTKADVGLSNVDNTSDINKPISTAQQLALDLKATQNPGICQKIPILPSDIIIDPVANTLTIATVKGGETISASNPIRFFTDGSGIITKHEKTAPVVFNFTNTNGVWYFHFDNTGNPVATQTPWSDFNVIATVYRFYLNDQLPNATKITVRAWECHLNDTSAADHAWKHAQGTQYVNGFDSSANVLAHLNGVPTVAPNADGRNSVVSLTTGKNSDDGLEYTVTNTTAAGKFNQDLGQTITASLNATNSALFKIRTNDAAGRLSFLPSTRFPFAWDVATNAPQFITASGVRTLVPDNNWFVYYSYALQDDVQGEAIKLVSAESAFTTWATAQAHTWKTLQNLYATLKDKEIRLLYKYIFYCDKTGGQAYPVGCKYSGLVLVEDQRTQLLTSTTSGGSTGSVIASNVTETTDGNVQAAIDGLRSSVLAIPKFKELIISKSTFNSIAEPGIYVNGTTAKNITGHRLTTNATDFSITVAGVTYTKTATYPIALAANAELIINDISIQTGYNVGNVILIIE